MPVYTYKTISTVYTNQRMKIKGSRKSRNSYHVITFSDIGADRLDKRLVHLSFIRVKDDVLANLLRPSDMQQLSPYMPSFWSFETYVKVVVTQQKEKEAQKNAHCM